MNSVEIKSFRCEDGSISLCEDTEGKDAAVVIPMWMFNQMIEAVFGVIVK